LAESADYYGLVKQVGVVGHKPAQR